VRCRVVCGRESLCRVCRVSGKIEISSPSFGISDFSTNALLQ
jgi:hypothetical protein